MLKVEKLSYSYPGYDDTLREVSFELGEGQVLAILGNNGAGKSTLLKCINHVLRPRSGKAYIDDVCLTELSNREIARRVAYVSQVLPLTEMTVHDTVMLGRRPYMTWGFTEEDHKIVHEAMERMGLVGDIQGRFLSQLSGGERQKVMVARALAQKPRLLLLDEPTSNLDIKNQYQVLRHIRQICREDKLSAILVIHDLSLALRFADRVLLLHEGKIYRDGGPEVLDTESLKAVYAIDARILELEGHRLVWVEE